LGFGVWSVGFRVSGFGFGCRLGSRVEDVRQVERGLKCSSPARERGREGGREGGEGGREEKKEREKEILKSPHAGTFAGGNQIQMSARWYNCAVESL